MSHASARLNSPPTRPRANQPTGGKWSGGARLVLGTSAVLVILAITVAFLPSLGSSSDDGPRLTHTVMQRDLRITVTEQGQVESAENDEIICQVRGASTVTWVIEGGSYVEAGDELVRLDTLHIEEQIKERTKYAHWSRSAAVRSEANLETAKLAVQEYQEGTFVAELKSLEKELAVAQAAVRAARNRHDYARDMFESGYTSELTVEEREFNVTRAELALESVQTRIEVLKRFTKPEQLQRLNGELAATKAKHEANVERAGADASRRARALEELEHCVVKAKRAGLVIHPNAAKWRNAPEIAEGATVHKDQVLLLMPDLAQMQVLVGIRESDIDRVKPGLGARVELPNRTFDGEVSTVAEIAEPSGWWTGNVVRYDTTVKLPQMANLMPGMSAEVEILVDEHPDVLTVPVAAVVETANGPHCWVKTDEEITPRSVELGDSNDVHTIVTAGLREGEEVVLNPMAIESARTMALKPGEEDGKKTDTKSRKLK